MADVRFVQGSTIMVDHTPGADVPLGAIVVVGDETRIAHRAIPANTAGALAAPSGTAVYRVPKATGVGTAIADGKRVWWEAGNSVGTETQGALKPLGISVGAAGDNDDSFLVRHCYFSKDA